MRSRKGISKDLVAALLARLEPSLHFRFSLIALGRGRQNQNGRETSSGQGVSIIREIGHFCTASISQATLRRTETTELTAKNNFDRHPGAGLRGLLSRLPCTHQPAIIPLRSSGGESGNLVIALPRRCQATSPDAPTKYRELRGDVGMQECFRDNHTTHIVRLVVPPTLILFAPTSPRAGTLRRGIKVRQCGVVCYPAAALSR